MRLAIRVYLFLLKLCRGIPPPANGCMAKLVNATLYNGESQTLGEEVDNSFRFESGYIHNLVSMNAPLYPNRGRMSGLSEDGKADRVVDKNGMVNPK